MPTVTSAMPDWSRACRRRRSSGGLRVGAPPGAAEAPVPTSCEASQNRGSCGLWERVIESGSPHRRHADEVVAGLRTDLRRGLTDAEVRSRLEQYGRNELAAERATPAWL